MQLHDIYIYPIKSLGGIGVQNAQVLERGFEFDRRLMLIDGNGRFISQRTYHQLALLKTEISPAGITVTNKKHPEQFITIPFNSVSGQVYSVSLWDDQVEALHLNSELDSWFGEFLQKPCKLVYMPENGDRLVDDRYAENGEHVSFADAFPYLLISQASLDDLNKRLPEPVPMDRFRPNLVIAGTEAYAEDTWKEIRIGEVRFKVAKPCARCILTTVDQNTGIRGKEPLHMLSGYRKVNNKVLFGQNLIALNCGTVTQNDQVSVISYKED